MVKVSIIVPVYNVEKYIEKCLDSLINQTLTDIEIICIDDCSTDNSMSVVERFSKRDDRIKIIHHDKNKGLGPARNTGLNYATGEYVMFLDSDDWLEYDACKMAYNQIVSNHNEIAFFGIYTYCEETCERQLDASRLWAFMGNLWNKNIKLADLNKPFMSYCECWYKIYSLEFLNKYNIRFTNNKCHFEDQPFYFKALLHLNSFSILDKPLYNYRIRKTSISQSVNSWDSLIETRKNILNYLNTLPNVDNQFIKFYIISCCYSLLGYYRRFSSIDKKSIPYLYKTMRELFILLNNQYDLSLIDELNEYETIKKIIMCNYSVFKFYQFTKQIFNLNNIQENNVKYKILTILGIKFIIYSKNVYNN